MIFYHDFQGQIVSNYVFYTIFYYVNYRSILQKKYFIHLFLVNSSLELHFLIIQLQFIANIRKKIINLLQISLQVFIINTRFQYKEILLIYNYFIFASLFSSMCKVPGCPFNHDKHYCKNCGSQDSNHRSANCYKTKSNCRAKGCNQTHDKHYCKNCGDQDSDHRASNCDRKGCCKVHGCKQKHQKHYCRVCRNKDADHFASKCPEGIDLYHGTKLEWAKSIYENGFQPSKDGRLGPGVYFTDDKDEAIRIAKRWGSQAAVLKCRLDEDSDFVKGGKHPHWVGVTTGAFQQYCVHPDHIKRIKIINYRQF